MDANNLKEVKILGDAKGILDMNNDREHTIINLVKNGSQSFKNIINSDVLFHSTLETFEKEKAPSLGLFYKYCFVSDLSKKLIFPNK